MSAALNVQAQEVTQWHIKHIRGDCHWGNAANNRYLS
jgi:hypothetical protein